MKKLFIVSLVILPIALAFLSGAEAIAKTYTTNFPATENTVSEAGVWNTCAASWTHIASSPGFAHGTQSGNNGYDDSYGFLSGFANDHEVSMTIKLIGTANETEALLRWRTSGNNTYGYEVLLNNGGGIQIVSWNGPLDDFTVLSYSQAFSAPAVTGDVFRAKIIGNVITPSLVHNGVTQTLPSFTDTSNLHPDGQPGVGFFWRTGDSYTNLTYGISQFTATDGTSIPTDSTPPTISLTSPANNAAVSGTVSVNASASDNVGVTSVQFYVNGALQATDTSTPYLYSWNTTSLAAGLYTLMAMAYDAAGNVGQSVNVPVTVVKDTIPPTVSMTAPTNNATVSGTITITASAGDNVGVSKVEFYKEGVLLTATNVAPYSYNWNTTSVANGSHILSAKAYDASNNIGQSSTVTVSVNNTFSDTVTPTVTTFNLPATATSLTVPVSSFTATDNVGVTGYCVSTINSSSGCAWSGTAPSSVTFVGTGARSAWAWAKDAAGNISAGAIASTTITVSGGSSINIGDTTVLANDDTVSGNTMIAQSATLGQSATVMSMSIYVPTAAGNVRMGIYDSTGPGGGPGGLLAYTGELVLASGWNSANVVSPVFLSTGTYWLTYLPSSNSAHFRRTGTGSAKYYSYTYGTLPSQFSTTPISVTEHWSFYATLSTGGTTAPTVSITAPANNATVSGTTSVTAIASDNLGVTNVEFYVNGSLSSSVSASPYSFSWNTTTVSNGGYTLFAKAYDTEGNVGQSASVSVTVNNSVPDTTPPTVAINSPSAGAKVGSSVTINASATDNVAVVKMQLYIDGVLKTTSNAGTLNWTWKTTYYARGAHVIKVKANDAANNSSSKSITVNK